MIQGGDGYQIVCDTAQLSQRSLIELLSTGATAIGAPDSPSGSPARPTIGLAGSRPNRGRHGSEHE